MQARTNVFPSWSETPLMISLMARKTASKNPALVRFVSLEIIFKLCRLSVTWSLLKLGDLIRTCMFFGGDVTFACWDSSSFYESQSAGTSHRNNNNNNNARYYSLFQGGRSLQVFFRHTVHYTFKPYEHRTFRASQALFLVSSFVLTSRTFQFLAHHRHFTFLRVINTSLLSASHRHFTFLLDYRCNLSWSRLAIEELSVQPWFREEDGLECTTASAISSVPRPRAECL